MDTPGGDIDSGNQLISTLKGLPQQVNTIINFAASMGFITVESLGTRYILPSGILMSHRAHGGAQGQIPGELNTRVKFFTDALDRQDARISTRVKMTKDDYQKLILNEYWVEGEEAVKENMADEVVEVRCDKYLSENSIVETVQTMFGPVQLTYSACPLINYPLAVNFSGLLSNNNSCKQEKIDKVKEVILKMVYDKIGFYNDYVLTNKVKEFFP